MTKFYDVTFQELSGRSVVKQKSLQTENHLTSGKMLVQAILKQIKYQINEDTFVTLNRHFVVRIDVKEVDGPVDKQVRRRDELMNVVNTLSNMGL